MLRYSVVMNPLNQAFKFHTNLISFIHGETNVIMLNTGHLLMFEVFVDRFYDMLFRCILIAQINYVVEELILF